MAKAWVSRTRLGKVRVRARGRVAGKIIEREMIVPDNDTDLAEEMKRELNRRFMLGDFSWLTEQRSRGKGPGPAGASWGRSRPSRRLRPPRAECLISSTVPSRP